VQDLVDVGANVETLTLLKSFAPARNIPSTGFLLDASIRGVENGELSGDR
jgi:hypothetical protein